MPTQPDDIALNKAAIIERALRRMKEQMPLLPVIMICATR